jgi:outer membrane receptor protein involved in Fe transport
MKTLPLTLTGLLLATSALVAPQFAFAQTAPQPAQTGAAPDQNPGASPLAIQPPPADGASDPVGPTPEALAPQASETPPADAATEVGEIVVLGRNIPEPLRETSEVVSVLTQEDLQRQGDDTAASALTRVAGLSLVQGRFVYVRGLGERYSSALLNGSPLPSPEPLQRVVPLDLFPSNILASANVQKTYSPQFPGEFGGGVIDLRTIGVPDEGFFTISASTGGDSETTFQPGLTYYGSDSDFFGYDDSTRRIPRALSNAIESGNQVVAGANFTPGQIAEIGRSFQNAQLNLLQQTNDVQPDVGLDVSAGDSYDLGFGRLGIIGVLGFDNSWQTRVGKQQGDSNITGGNIEARDDFDLRATQNDVVLNGLLGIGLEAGNHRVDWTTLYVHSTTKEARSRQGPSELFGRSVRDDFTEWFERSLIDTQLAGSHEFSMETGDLNVDWRAAYAKTTRDAPYEKSIRYVLTDPSFGAFGNRYVYDPSGSGSSNQTAFSEIEDEVTSAGVDFAYTLPLSGVRDAVFSAGLAYLDNERQSERRTFAFRSVRPLTFQEQFQRVDFLFSDFNIRPDFFVLEETTGSQGAAAYDAKLEVQAAYAQVDAEIIPLVRVAAGFRYEDAQQSVLPRNVFAAGGVSPTLQATQLEEQYFLPTATVTWNFAEDQQIRLGASKTLARPQFRELAFQEFQDTESDRTFVGNPFLEDSELLNLDARYEWFFSRGQYVTVGGFYKDIDKPIESLVLTGGAGLRQTFLNAPSATIYGLELEGRKYYDIPEPYQFLGGDARLFLAANYTYSKAEVKAESGDTVRSLQGGGVPQPATDLVQDGSQLQGQSEHLANLQFGIEDDEAMTQATVLINYVSERISARGILGAGGVVVQPDFIQDPGVTVDFVLRQGFTLFGGREFTVGFEARNLTGEDFEEYQEFGSGRVDLNSYELGTSLSVSLTTRF